MEQKITQNTSIRFSDAELEEFKGIFQKKLDTARKESQQLLDILNDKEGNGDTSDEQAMLVEQIHQLIQRHEMWIVYLQDSLLKIEDKSFGVSNKTGELMDMESLLNPPHGKLN